jgi:hypothetical protein
MHTRNDKCQEKILFQEKIRYKIGTQKPEDEQKTFNVWVKQ